MNDLLKQLQALIPLAAAATLGHWYGENDEEDDYRLMANHDGQVAEIANMSWVMSDGSQADAAFIAAARNLLTPENLQALCAALAPQWVSVTDRLPEENGVYLVFGNCTGEENSPPTEDMARFYIEAAIFSKYRQPSHWMPLPTPPATMEGSPAHE